MGRSNNRKNSSAEANATTTDQSNNSTSQAKSKLDYPIVVLGPTNYPEFFLGFIAYQGAKKSGGADVKYYLQNGGKEPIINGVYKELDKRWAEDAKIEYESKRALKRHQEKVDKHYKAIDDATKELRRMQADLRVRRPTTTTLSESTGDDSSESADDINTASGNPAVTPTKTSPLPFSMRDEIRATYSKADLDDAQSERSTSSLWMYDEAATELLEIQMEHISNLEAQSYGLEEVLDDLSNILRDATIDVERSKSEKDDEARTLRERRNKYYACLEDAWRDLLDTNLFLSAAHKKTIAGSVEMRTAIDDMKETRDLLGIIDIISQGMKVEEVKSEWQIEEAKSQFMLISPGKGESLAAWKARFDFSRLENIRRGVIFDERAIMHHYIKQVEANYSYKFVLEHFRGYKVSMSSKQYKPLPKTVDELDKTFAEVVIENQQYSKNVITGAKFELANTASQKEQKPSGPTPSANVAKVEPPTNAPIQQGSPATATANAAASAPTKKDISVPLCRVGCKDSNGQPARHYLQYCMHPDMTDKLRATAAQNYAEKLKSSKLESQVKTMAGTKAATNVTGNKKQSNSVTASLLTPQADEDKRYTLFHYDAADDYQSDSDQSGPTVNMLNGFPRKCANAVTINGVKQAQYDNGANVSVVDSSSDLSNVQTIKDITVTGWSGASGALAVNQIGTLPGFGEVYIREGANCIFDEFQFFSSGWKKSTGYGIEPQSRVKMEMYIYWTKAGVTICFMRHTNRLWYAPYDEIIAKIKQAHSRSVVSKAEVHVMNTHRSRPVNTAPVSEKRDSSISPQSSIVASNQSNAIPVRDVTDDVVPSNPTNNDVLIPPPAEPPPQNPAASSQLYPNEAVINRNHPNYEILRARLNHRGGKRHFTEREIKHIFLVHELHLNGHYSPNRMKQIILHIPGCPITVADINNWEDAMFPCASCVQGTYKTAPQQAFQVPVNAKPGQFFEADLTFTLFEAESNRKRPGLLFLCLVTGIMFYHSMQSRSIAAMTKASAAFYRFHSRHFPDVECKLIRTDHEDALEYLTSSFKGCVWAAAAIGDHPNHVESAQGHLKRRVLCTLRELIRQGIDIPRHIITLCMEHMVQLSLHIPNDHLGGACPGSFADNFTKLTFDEFIAARFGRVGYFKTYPIPQGDLDAKGELGMVVGFEPATPSNLLVYLPRTNAIVSRGDFKEVKDLTEFKELMTARAKGAPITADAIQTRREFLQSNASTIPDDGIETVINSLQVTQSANPDFSIADLNIQMKAQNAIAIFGEDEVQKGVLKEIDNLISTYGVTQFVKETSIPSRALILDSTDIYKGKTKNGIFTEVKVRVAVLGCNQPPNSYGQTSSPTVDTTSVNAALSLAKYYKATISSADVPAAYLQSNLTEEIYMRFSKKMSGIILKARPELSQFTDKKGRLLVKLLKSLYGLKQAGANWFMELVAAITGAGFIQCKSDPCVFYMYADDPSGDPQLKKICFITIHVDDFLRICNHPEFAQLLETSLAKYGDLRWEHGTVDYLVVHYVQQPDFSIRADMSAMTERIFTDTKVLNKLIVLVTIYQTYIVLSNR